MEEGVWWIGLSGLALCGLKAPILFGTIKNRYFFPFCGKRVKLSFILQKGSIISGGFKLMEGMCRAHLASLHLHEANIEGFVCNLSMRRKVRNEKLTCFVSFLAPPPK